MQCCKCLRRFNPDVESADDWYVTGAKSADGKPETWDICPECAKANGIKTKRIGYPDYEYTEEEQYVFDCPTCGQEFIVKCDYDDFIISSYGECPDCVAMYNAGV